MAWYAYGRTRTIGDGVTVLSSYSRAGEGIWLSDKDITDSSMPSLTADRGILIDLSDSMLYGHVYGYLGGDDSAAENWPIITDVYDQGWHHDSNHPYIGLANARIFLSKTQGGTSGADITSILNNSVYLTDSYNGVIDGEINWSTDATTIVPDGYEVLYASGSSGNFPDYRYDGTDYVSYCYGPTLATTITSYSDINALLDQGYWYAGIYFYMAKQSFLNNTYGTDYGYVDILAPSNTYCTASYHSSFTGSKVKPDRWKDIQSAKVYVNGSWKDVRSMKVYVNGAWKEVPQTQNLEWAGK